MKKGMFVFVMLCMWMSASLAHAGPGIRIEYPPDNYMTNDASIEVRGAATDVSHLSVNGTPVRMHENGRFATRVNLKEGSNDFVLRGTDGNRVTLKDLRVNRFFGKGKDYQEITYKFLYPPVPTYTKTTKNKLLIKASARGATKAYINGEPVAVKNNRIYKVVDLPAMGRNDISVTFANKYRKYATTVVAYRMSESELLARKTGGEEADESSKTPAGREAVLPDVHIPTVQAAEAVAGTVAQVKASDHSGEQVGMVDGTEAAPLTTRPFIQIDFPPDNSTTGSARVAIRGEAANADSLYLNDNPVRMHPNGRFAADVLLREGENSFLLRAANGPEMVTRCVRIAHVPAKPQPPQEITCTFYSPQDITYTRTSKDKLLIKAKVEGATEAYINGNPVKIHNDSLYHVVDLPVIGRNIVEVVFANRDTTTNAVIKAYRVAAASGEKAGEVAAVQQEGVKKVPEHAGRVTVTSLQKAKGQAAVESAGSSGEPVDKVSAADANRIQKHVIKEELAQELREQIKKELYSEIASKVEHKIESAVEKQQQEQSSESAQAKKEMKEELAKELREQIKKDLEKEIEAKKAKEAKEAKEAEEKRKLKVTNLKTAPEYEDELTKAVGRDLPPVTLKLRDADIKDVVDILARKSGLNIVADESLIGKVTIDLHDVAFTTALNLVLKTHGYTYTVMGNTLIIGDRSKIAVPTTLQPSVFKLYHSRAAKVEKVIKPFLGKDESVAVAEEENSIIAYASPATLKKIKDTIANLDRNIPRQVFIEAKIIEVASNALQKLGIDWDGQAALTVGESKSDSGSESGSGGTSGSQVTLWVPELLINYLQDGSDSKVLASPKITAVDGEEAFIHVGDQYPYMETDIDTKSGEKTTTVKFVDTGIKLKITPYINPENETIKLLVEPEVSFIHSFAGPNNEIPWVRTRKAETTVRIKNGQTVVIGGLLNTEDRLVKKSIPILGDIPLIGNLFTNTTTEQMETELLIIITSKILE